MPSPIPEHYHQVFDDVEQNWAMERLLEDLRIINGNNGFTNAQIRHLKALLAWSDLKATGQLARCDRLISPTGVIAKLLCCSENSVKTEVSRSITPCIKQLLNLDPRSRVKIDTIPNWLQEQGYRRSMSTPTLEEGWQRGRSPLPKTDVDSDTNSNQSNPSRPVLNSSVSRHSRKFAPVSSFYGRKQEMRQLDTFLYDQKSHLILVYGRGGVGKTWLVAQWLESAQSYFPHFISQRVWDRPPLTQLVWGIMQQLPGYTKADIPDSADQQISWLISALCTHKCLVVLDDIHYLFQTDIAADASQAVDGLTISIAEAKGYEILFEQLATNRDYQQSESCVVGIGWYRPAILARVEDTRSPIPTLDLRGLDFDAAQHILAECNLMNDHASWQKLVDKYRGFPYSLKLVGTHIRQMYGGDIRGFLADETVFLGDTESLIHQQFQCVSDICKLVWLVLSKEGSCTSVSDMRRQINEKHQLGLSASDVGRSLQTLYEMKLIEKEGDRFSPPPDITKYALKRYQLYLPHLVERLRLPEPG